MIVGKLCAYGYESYDEFEAEGETSGGYCEYVNTDMVVTEAIEVSSYIA